MKGIGKLIKQEAINILARYVANDIEINNFWNDEAYKKEIEALRKLGRLNKEEIERSR